MFSLDSLVSLGYFDILILILLLIIVEVSHCSNPCYYLHIPGHCQTLMRDSYKLTIIVWNLARPLLSQRAHVCID